MTESFAHQSIVGFDWDRRKNDLNIEKHGIDFDDALKIFYSEILLRRSNKNDEERWVAVGEMESRLIAVVFTMRSQIVRIISARRARKNEERDYRNKKMGRPSEREDRLGGS